MLKSVKHFFLYAFCSMLWTVLICLALASFICYHHTKTLFLTEKYASSNVYENQISLKIQELLEPLVDQNDLRVFSHIQVAYEQKEEIKEDLLSPQIEWHSQSKRERAYAFNKKTTAHLLQKEQIQKMSLVVLLNKTKRSYSPQEQLQIKSLIQSAVAFDAKRGDSLKLLVVPFEKKPICWLYSFCGVSVLMLFLCLLLMKKKALTQLKKESLVLATKDKTTQIEKTEEIKETVKSVWNELEMIDVSTWVDYLKKEYPQTIAVILSRLKPQLSAQIISLLPETLVVDVVMRLSLLGSVDPYVLKEIETTLQKDFMMCLPPSLKEEEVCAFSDIFNYLDTQTQKHLIDILFDCNKEMADNLRACVFTFEDLLKVPESKLQELIKSVDIQTVAFALKGSSADLQALFLRSMPKEDLLSLKMMIETCRVVRLKEIDKAQSVILEKAKSILKELRKSTKEG